MSISRLLRTTLIAGLSLGLTAAGVSAASADVFDVINDPNFIRPLTSSTDKWVTPAQPGGYTTVVLGDSQASGQSLPIWADDRGCQRSDAAWPEQLRKLRGQTESEFYNASCPGAAINSGHMHLSDLVRRVEQFHGLGPNTKDIYIQLGQNDVWGNEADSNDSVINCLILGGSCTTADADKNRVQDARAVTGEEYAARMKPVIDYLRYYAPNADLHLVSYISNTTFGNPHVCFNVAGFNVVRYAPALSALHEKLFSAQQQAATILGMNFIDLKSLTVGHESCASEPWTNGFGDPRVPTLGMWWHPTATGDAVTARHIAAVS